MKLESLEVLYKSMKAQSLEMQQFSIKINLVTFDCLFSTREVPFILTLTSQGSDSKFFKFEIHRGFVVENYLDGVYSDLVSILRVDGNTGKPLIPKDFFAELDSLIPRVAKIYRVPSCNEIIKLRPDIIEDRNKSNFDGWIYWTEASKKSPTKENLKKTLILLGRDAYSHSKQYNASSSWTA